MVGLGANLGGRQEALSAAISACADLGELWAVSSLYESDPVGPPQPEFLNAALRLGTELRPEALLERLLAVERAAGRERRERWGPRPLDLDILWIEGLSVASEGLSVPHPRLTERAFALLPLLDVAPDARDPRTGEPYAEIAGRIDRSGVRCLSQQQWWRSAKILGSFGP